MTKNSGGSGTTYYCDNEYIATSRIACFGGRWADGSQVGVFYLSFSRVASDATSAIGDISRIQIITDIV